jgi:microcystin-dependent protein
MAWTKPPLTWNVGQLVTAALLNVHLRDQLLYLFGQKVEPGVVVDFAGSSAPSGYLLCDGTSYATATYPSLFAAIGYTWGGSGANFNVPDLRSRVTVGAGAGAGLTARTLAAAGGEENHVLTTAELAGHTHGVTDGTHTHTVTVADPTHNHTQNAHGHGVTDPGHVHVETLVGNGGNAVSGTGAFFSPIEPPPAVNTGSAVTGVTVNNGTATNVAGATGVTASTDTRNANVGANTGSNGSGAGHNNLQPFAVLNKIVKC